MANCDQCERVKPRANRAVTAEQFWGSPPGWGIFKNRGMITQQVLLFCDVWDYSLLPLKPTTVAPLPAVCKCPAHSIPKAFEWILPPSPSLSPAFVVSSFQKIKFFHITSFCTGVVLKILFSFHPCIPRHTTLCFPFECCSFPTIS